MVWEGVEGSAILALHRGRATSLEYDVKPVTAFVVGEAPARAGEVGVQRRRVPVALMNVAPGGVGLPDLDQAATHGPPVAVEHAPGNDNSLSEGLAPVLAR